jgi:hypothetical protein
MVHDLLQMGMTAITERHTVIAPVVTGVAKGGAE